MPVERRRQARQKLYSPEYFDLDADNGGILTDLSEGGAGFQAVSPVEKDQVVALSFSLGGGYRIEARARITWIGANRNSGGATFLSLRDDSGSILREWLSKSANERHQDALASAHNESHAAVPLNEPIPSPAAELMAAETGAAIGAITAPSESADAAAQMAAASAADASSRTALKIEPVEFPAVRSAQGQSSAPKISVRWPSSVLGGISAHDNSAKTAGRNQPAANRPGDRSSFSTVPSIGAWSKAERARQSGRSAASHGGPGSLLPPDAGPIFSRPGNSPAVERESGGQGKKIAAVIAFLLITAAIAWYRYYPHGPLSRQMVGDAVVHLGNLINGTSNAAPSNSAPSQASRTQPAVSHRAAASQPNQSATGNADTVSHSASSNAAEPPKAGPAKTEESQASSAASPAKQDAKTTPHSGLTQTTQAAQTAQPKKISDTPASAAAADAPPTIETKTPGYLSARETEKSGAAPPKPAAPAAQLGGAEYARAEQYLNGKGVNADPAEAAQWFWRSLEAGNTDAAIPLADLYLAGKGVNRSCVQARVLLNAAAAKGNAEAIRKVGQLPENCE